MTILAAACNIICGVEPILGYEMTREAYQPGDHFPYKELSILSIVLFSSTLALTGLFPYAGFMVVDLGMAKDIDSAGYYAGYLASAMMFGRLSSSIFWGRVADRIGRKPVLYVGSLSIIVFSLTFGLSLNIWMALGSRFLLGVFNPIVGIGKTLVSETGMWSMGMIVGPAVGGLLSHPTSNFPAVFGHSDFLSRFPYFIPNLITALIACIGIVPMFIFFPETLPRQRPAVAEIPQSRDGDTADDQNQKVVLTILPEDANDEVKNDSVTNGVGIAGSLVEDGGDVDVDESESAAMIHHSEDERSAASASTAEPPQQKPQSQTQAIPSNKLQLQTPSSSSSSSPAGSGVLDLLRSPKVAVNIITYFFISMISIAYDEVFPLWVMSSPQLGGFGYSSLDIGKIMSVTGMALVVFNITIYPLVVNFFGCKWTFVIGHAAIVPMILGMTEIKRITDDNTILFWAASANTILVKCFSNLCFASIALVINQSVPTTSRASANGLAMTIGSLAKALGPMCGANIFAWSIGPTSGPADDKRAFPFDYHFVFLLLAILGSGNCVGFWCMSVRKDARGAASGSPPCLAPCPMTPTEGKGLIEVGEGEGVEMTSTAALKSGTAYSQLPSEEAEEEHGA